MDATLVCLSALLMLAPTELMSADGYLPADSEVSELSTRETSAHSEAIVPYRLASSFEEVIVRAQSMDSPYYDYVQSSPMPGGAAPQYPYSPGTTPYAPPVVPTQPATPFMAPGAPYTPVTPANPFGGPLPAAPPAAPFQQFGVNGAQPYDFGASGRLDLGYIAPASAGGGYGEFDVFELDLGMPYVSATGDGNIFTFTPQYDMRLFNGPSSPPGAPGFPSDLYRFGWDFQYDFITSRSNWSGELGFNPSINTDFEKSLTMDAVNWDGRAIAYVKTAPNFTLALGVLYYDRVDDKILPYAGVIWLPTDRLELRLVFPEPRISYFAGHVWGKPTWIYARAKYNIESYQVELPAGTRNQLQREDWRIMFGARKDQGWGGTFLEAGWVINREIEFAKKAPGFGVDSAFMFRGGVRF